MPKLTIADHLEINLVRTGPRGSTPMVFLHGLGLDLTSWDHQLSEFAEATTWWPSTCRVMDCRIAWQRHRRSRASRALYPACWSTLMPDRCI